MEGNGFSNVKASVIAEVKIYYQQISENKLYNLNHACLSVCSQFIFPLGPIKSELINLELRQHYQNKVIVQHNKAGNQYNSRDNVSTSSSTAKLGLSGDTSLLQRYLDQLYYLKALLGLTSPSVLNNHKLFRSVTAAAFREQAWPPTDNQPFALSSQTGTDQVAKSFRQNSRIISVLREFAVSSPLLL